MEEIKVGKYGLESKTEGMLARTTNGIIGIIINANEDEMMNGPELKVNEKIYCIERDSIKEIKENIINLIEVGDYVNGILVTEKESTLLYTEIKGIDGSGYHIPISQYGEGIKTILTKEQYMQNCYTVEGKEEWKKI